MPKNDDVERVLRKHRNAIKKVSRLEHKGIRIRNTDENPSVPANDIRSMNARQLRAHEKQLDAFTSRENQYVPGADNQAIRRKTLENYLKVQEQNNRLADQVENAVRDIKLPGSDMTVGTLLAVRGKLPQSMESQERFFEKINRGASNLNGEAAAQKAISELQRRMSNAVINQRLEKRLNSIRAALTYSGNADLVDVVNNLSMAEQIFMIDYSTFGKTAALYIDSAKYSSDGELSNAEYEERNGVDDEGSADVHDNLKITLDWVRKNAAATARAARTTGLRKRRRGK